MSMRRIPLALIAVASLAGCGGGRATPDPCSNEDGALTNASFVFVEAPRSGDRVSNGFRASGCSSTFEGTIVWRLLARDGRALSRGVAQGGSLEPHPFGFAVRYTVRARQVGRLVVSAPRVTNEGFPPVTNVIPLVLDT
jgi:hypothetical protein